MNINIYYEVMVTIVKNRVDDRKLKQTCAKTNIITI